MPRIQAIAPENATGKSKDLMDAIHSKLGLVPNMARAMAHAPSVLEGYLSFSGALAKGSLSAKVREQIALTVAERNGCEYCLSAHSAIGKLVGLSDEQIHDSRNGRADDSKTDAVLRLAAVLVDNRGQISDRDWNEARDAGLNEAAIAEVVANVALNILTNYFNHVSDPVIDFPRVTPLAREIGSARSSDACCSMHA